VPAPYATLSPSPSAAPPTAAPDLTPLPALPVYGPEGYRLKEWTEQDAWAVRAEVIDIIKSYNWSTWSSPYEPYDYLFFQSTLEHETFLRFSDRSTEAAALAWHISRLDIQQHRGVPIDPSSPYRFGLLLENSLNSGETNPEQMSEWLKNHGFGVIKIIPDENLYGDGQAGWVFQVDVLDIERNPQSLFALSRTSENQYTIHQLIPWISQYHGYLLFELRDSTSDGRSEVIVMTHFYGVGSSTWEDSTISIYEWKPDLQAFMDLTQNIPVLEMDEFTHVITYLDPPRWVLGTWGDSQIPAITATVEFPAPKGCPFPGYQIVYLWNGNQYAWAGEGYAPYDPAAPISCQIAWALQAGEPHEQALEILNLALESEPEEYTQDWGPAAEDYLRFQLGVLYALGGQRQQALRELHAVSDRPVHPEYPMPSRLAQRFLSAYTSEEAWRPCHKMVSYLNQELGIKGEYSVVFGFLLRRSIVEEWGIDDPRWIWDGSPACNLNAALSQSLNSARLQNTTQLVEWLNQIGISWGPVVKGDIDGNGVEDWLVTLRNGPREIWQVWGLLREGESITPVYVEDYWTDNLAFSLRLLHPDPQAKPAGLLVLGRDYRIFGIQQAHSDLALISEKKVNPVKFDSQMLYKASSIYVSEGEQTIILMDEKYEDFYYPYLTKYSEYEWEPASQAYVLRITLPSEQQQKIEAAETLLFEANQPEQTVEILQQLLSGHIIELVLTWSEGSYNIGPPITRTYIQYLLGLAFELSGDEANAVHVYWLLWHDHPESPYTLLAGRKLVPILEDDG
jgi:hypothetical protein